MERVELNLISSYTFGGGGGVHRLVGYPTFPIRGKPAKTVPTTCEQGSRMDLDKSLKKKHSGK